jgi:hypothetical protein
MCESTNLLETKQPRDCGYMQFADELTDAEAKRKMIKIAEDYEALAIQAAQRLRHHASATIRNWRR